MHWLRHGLDVIEEFVCRIPDWIWVPVERAAKFVAIVLVVCIPVFMASLEEMLASAPAEPTGDCIRLMTGDSQAQGAGAFCFVKDAGAQWLDKLVEFPATISGQCESMADEQAKKECQERKRRRVDQVAKHTAAFMAGILVAQPGR